MNLRLTSLTKAGGCGCKLSPKELNEILKYKKGISTNLLIGNETRDDAAIYKFSDTEGIVSTVDFFTPIVDDPFIFGKIAAANALSDVFAMGGKPFLALSILGVPSNSINPEMTRQIIEGAIDVCNEVDVVLGGGHTIDNPQPIFGLAVNGRVSLSKIKSNNHAKEGDLIYLTKPLGVGILSTAFKIDKVDINDFQVAINWMTKVNSIGFDCGQLDCVNALTDVTGYGLLGHLKEICEGSNVKARIDYSKIPIIPNLEKYINQNIITSGGKRNWESYKDKIEGTDELNKWILSDPQSNGGLLLTIPSKQQSFFETFLSNNGLSKFINPIGEIVSSSTIGNLIIIE